MYNVIELNKMFFILNFISLHFVGGTNNGEC